MNKNLKAGEKAKRRFDARRGTTLVEVMMAAGLFTFIASGVGMTLLQMRKAAEGNIGEATAQAIAGGIIEQLQFAGYANLAASPSLTLKFLSVSSANFSTIQDYPISFASDRATYTEIGEVADGVVKGVVLDVDYVDATTGAMVRPRRYMKMNINLQRTVDSVKGKIGLVLSYQWEPPDRKGIFITRELRTLISQAGCY